MPSSCGASRSAASEPASSLNASELRPHSCPHAGARRRSRSRAACHSVDSDSIPLSATHSPKPHQRVLLRLRPEDVERHDRLRMAAVPIPWIAGCRSCPASSSIAATVPVLVSPLRELAGRGPRCPTSTLCSCGWKSVPEVVGPDVARPRARSARRTPARRSARSPRTGRRPTGSSGRRSATTTPCSRADASRAGARTSQVALSASVWSASTFVIGAVSRSSRSLRPRLSRSVKSSLRALDSPRDGRGSSTPNCRAASARRASSQSRSCSVETQSSRL